MKSCTQFQLMVDDKVDIRSKLTELETLIAIARKVIDYQVLRNLDPEPLKFIQHDYNLVLGDFGIDFLNRADRPDAARSGHQTDTAPGPGFPNLTWGSKPGPL